MPHNVEGDELRAALRECLRGHSDLLTVARSLLVHVEGQQPMAPDGLALHHRQFDRVAEELRQLQALLDAFVVPPSDKLH